MRLFNLAATILISGRLAQSTPLQSNQRKIPTIKYIGDNGNDLPIQTGGNNLTAPQGRLPNTATRFKIDPGTCDPSWQEWYLKNSLQCMLGASSAKVGALEGSAEMQVSTCHSCLN
jgi:hypothetical protein